jgi:transcriptional regulator with XRE-family HTH domain
MALYADFEWSEVGKRIRVRRLAQEKTQQQLAGEAGLTQNAIFRLEVGNTNPQLSTLRVVARALGTNVRELVCGVRDEDPRLGERLPVVRRILESGDPAAVRAMDHGLENATTLLERTSGFWENTPTAIKIGGRTFPRPGTRHTEPLKGQRGLPSSKSPAGSASSMARSARKESEILKKKVVETHRYRTDDAPNLPVGRAPKAALPETNRRKEQHGKLVIPAALSHQERPKA